MFLEGFGEAIALAVGIVVYTVLNAVVIAAGIASIWQHPEVLYIWEAARTQGHDASSPAIPNAIAALLIYIRDLTGQIPHVYFGWTEGNPIAYLKFLAFGDGDTAPVTREVLRQFEPDPARRPRVHVG